MTQLGDQPANPATTPGHPEKSAQPNKLLQLMNNRSAMFLMLFCVTGFLGIPFLCKSSAFSTTEKIIWSIVVTIYTCILLWITGAIVWWSYNSILESLGCLLVVGNWAH